MQPCRAHSAAAKALIAVLVVTLLLLYPPERAAAAPSKPPGSTAFEVEAPSPPAVGASAGLLQISVPDAAGYIYADGADGPRFDFENIATTGTQLALGDDEMSSAVALGFAFAFYGTTYDGVYVCSNGFITFLPDQSCPYVNTALPDPADPNGLIAAWWADLNPVGLGTIKTQVLGIAPYRRFIVQFTDVPHYDRKDRQKDPVTFQIKLFETTGAIEVHYVATSKVNMWHTAGIENVDGTVATLYHYERNSQIQNSAVRYWIPTCRAQIDGGSVPYYTHIREAVDDAVSGDLIKISGHCAGVHAQGGLYQSAYVTESLSLRGGYSHDFLTWDPGAYPTTLDAMGRGRVIYAIGNITPTFEHVTVTGGNASGLGGDLFGDDAGGGIYVIGATATISACRITGNTAGQEGWGGGVYLRDSAGTVLANTVTGNTGFGGGGIEADDSSESVIAGNIITGNHVTGGGGGMYLYRSSALLERNVIRQNTAGSGGGVYITAEAPRLHNTLIADNQASGSGAGLYISGATPALVHTTLANNTGGEGSGVYVTSNVSTTNVHFTNTILVNHTVGIDVAAGNAASLNATLWGNSTDITGTLTLTRTQDVYGDPAFIDPDAGDYRINTVSAAFDAGILTTVGTDLDGDARATARLLPDPPDLGADENPLRTALRPINGTLTFGAAQTTMTFTDTASLQAITVTLDLVHPTPKSKNKPLRRTFTIHADTVTPFSGTLTLYYTDDEVTESGSEESLLLAYREVNGSWVIQPSVVDTASNAVHVPGVTGLGRWALGDADHSPQGPTAVTLVDVRARVPLAQQLAAALLLVIALPASALLHRRTRA